MRKAVRRSARALVAAMAVAAVYAAWPSAGTLRAPFRKAPVVVWIDKASVMPAAASHAAARPQAGGEAFAALDGESAHCLAGACAVGPAIKPSDPCEPCLGFAEPSQADFARSLIDEAQPVFVEAQPALVEAGLEGAAGDLGGDPNTIYLAGFEPVASAAPAPEISTAAMLTLGFAAIVRGARRARRDRRAPLKTGRQHCPC